MGLFGFVSAMLLYLAQSKISEYQLESEALSQCELLRAAGTAGSRDYIPQCSEDGRFRHVQCDGVGAACWCVDAVGAEVSGSRRNGSAVHCLSPCQQAQLRGDGPAVPRCSPSGAYEPVQCDRGAQQCWCVDAEGMEIYGTRQNGNPSRCPGSCEVRERRLLHGVGGRSPPQCSEDGAFLPVQCKFVNTSDMMEFDLLHAFNRLPTAFQTFSSFRRTFPEVSGYCFCGDSRGRELPNTGLELLLGEVYDTAFSGVNPRRSFTQSNIYRILQRRFLGVRLAMTGRFRCPTKCETERALGAQAGSVFVPSCDASGAYVPAQCQAGGQCWCVDPNGNEILGTRQRDKIPNCSAGVKDCLSERRQALSRLLYGPSGHFSQHDVFSTPQLAPTSLSACGPEIQKLLATSALLQALPVTERADVDEVLAEVIQGLFPTGALAQKALSLATNPKRLQENLFGGKFLKNAVDFNFTGAVGSRGTFSFRQSFSQVGLLQPGEDLMQLAKTFSPETGPMPQGLNLDQEISDAFGRSVNLKTNRDLIRLVSATLENERFLAAVGDAISLLQSEDDTRLGPLLGAVFQSRRSRCARSPSLLYVPQCTDGGQYQEVQCHGAECWCVDLQGVEVAGSRSTGPRPRCPSPCERERDAALRVKEGQAAGSEVFIPTCEEDGSYVPLQCLGQSCVCMDRSGRRHSAIMTGPAPVCPTECQAMAVERFLTAVRSALSDPASLAQLSDLYIPRCEPNGGWHPVQCDGPPEQAFLFYREWVEHNAAGQPLAVSDLLGVLRGYAERPEVTATFRGFLVALFDAGHHRVFPSLAGFNALADLPPEVVLGAPEAVSGPSVLLNPLALWKLLRGGATQYPGQLSDFSLPLGHVHLRSCWCVGPRGDEIANSRAAISKAPECPGSCTLIGREVDRFLEEAERMMSDSGSSRLPIGYSYLLAEGVRLTQEELLQPPGEGLFPESLLRRSDYALRLAALSTLHSSWQTHLTASEKESQGFLLGDRPYTPQCDAHGRWLPSQCHPSTGHCWCVDEEGTYIPGSLTRYSRKPLQCQTQCQRAHAQAMISDWTQSDSDISVESSYIPSCSVDGEFSVVQKQTTGGVPAWCVSLLSGKTIQPADLSRPQELQCPSWCQLLRSQVVQRHAGIGYEPGCLAEGLFSPVQCVGADCWCVSPDGQELPQTRIPQGSGKTPSCDPPRCQTAFGDPRVAHGAVVCSAEAEGGLQKQRCRLVCHRGYEDVLSVRDFLCDVATGSWVTDAPLPHACQRPQTLQTIQSSSVIQLFLTEGQEPCSSLRSSLQLSLLLNMRAQGLCSLMMPGRLRPVSVCDESSVSLECVNEFSLRAQITWKAWLSALPVKDFPDLRDIDLAFRNNTLLDGVITLTTSDPYRAIFTSDPTLESSSTPSFGCSQGYQLAKGNSGCVVCPAGTFSGGRGCSPCPQGSYQEQEGQESCNVCPPGSSTAAEGAFRATHCLTECQRSGLRCSERGHFLSAQQDFLSGKWLCVTSSGEKLGWTSSLEPLSESVCQALERFEAVPSAGIFLQADDAAVLSPETPEMALGSPLVQCVSGCAKAPSCHHSVFFTEGGKAHCTLYSTDSVNVDCKTSEKAKGFLGNPGADNYQSLTCSVKIKESDRPNLVVLRKKGHDFTLRGEKTFERLGFRKLGSGVYRTVVFSANGSTLTDAHWFCLNECSRERCCDGFVLNQNVLNGGTLMCGLVSRPDALMCADEDWDVAGVAEAGRVCGAEVKYDKRRKQFTFSLGGQDFTITDEALPTSSKNKSDYQASIIGFQRIYLWKDSDMDTRPLTFPGCVDPAPQQLPEAPLSEAVKEAFVPINGSAVLVDPDRNVPSLRYWIFKHRFSAQEAELWCLKRCEEETLCRVADVRDDSAAHRVCSLYPDSRVCGAYDKPLRQACPTVLPQDTHTAYSKNIDLSGSVRSFYSGVPFAKMVSYSVRSRVDLSHKPLTEGFRECERRCDEDPCCRGIGYVRDTQPPGGATLCLTLNSFGIQTCGEGERTSWRVQDCTPSRVETSLYPFGWYEKPVSQWTKSPRLCPPFKLPPPARNVTWSDWEQLDVSSTRVDAALSTYDIVHISIDISEDEKRTREWCLSACEGRDSCSAVTFDLTESAVRCILYPDTSTCSPSPSGQVCHLVIREPAQQVYLRREPAAELTSVFIPAHGTLQGKAHLTPLGSHGKVVSQFWGVPYARPPIGDLRFSPPQPAQWSGTWNATFPRPSCLQPGDGDSSHTSEDCLYLNIFTPRSIRRKAAVLVFFYNPASANQDGLALLDGSYLAAVGDIIVLTVHTRVAAFGFLSSGSVNFPGNYGVQDQAAALRWVQESISLFGGDPKRVTVGAERSGADVAALHLTTSPVPAPPFQRMLLMGGSVFSPASVINGSKAQGQAAALAQELNCSSSDPDQLGLCLRRVPAQDINAAQTKLLAVSGPLQAWAPVVDGTSVQEKPSLALQNARFHRVDLMVGSNAGDGLISRAKKIKRFEELQGRADSKTAFYEALWRSLGGDDADALVKEAATWFYSLQHSPSPAGYSRFSRALQNATRDLFILCPTLKMADFWAANTRSNVFTYHVPESMAQRSTDVSVPLEVQLVFGLPHDPRAQQLFTTAERRLSLQMMSYVANFIKSGNPNSAPSFTLVSSGEELPHWPQFLSRLSGDNYKEVDPALSNRQGLRRSECSFWSDYVPVLTASKVNLSSEKDGPISPARKAELLVEFLTTAAPSKPKDEKDAYN